MSKRTARHRLGHRLGIVLALAMLTSACTHVHVLFLASDRAGGRNNGTDGSSFAQNYIIGYLQSFAQAMNGTTIASAYRSAMTGGTNIIAVIPGSDPVVADEYVVVGAHYDHIGGSCATEVPTDVICNGATDNATSVGIVLEVGRALAATPPRRSVILALWDREEDGLIGSREWVANPTSPIDQVVAYVNFDITGANLLPSLRDFSLAVGAESGGTVFQSMVTNAIASQPLDSKLLSATFGQGRSDYVNFLSAGIPSVFFTDSTGPCYHTAQDEYGVVDIVKLQQQTEIATTLTRDLADSTAPPAFVPGTPAARYEDAVVLSQAINRAISDIGRFTAAQQNQVLAIKSALDGIVAAGPNSFDANALGVSLIAAQTLVSLLAEGSCDGFLANVEG
jgi:Zn-dependent M28 family amino/carboxypeptidase